MSDQGSEADREPATQVDGFRTAANRISVYCKSLGSRVRTWAGEANKYGKNILFGSPLGDFKQDDFTELEVEAQMDRQAKSGRKGGTTRRLFSLITETDRTLLKIGIFFAIVEGIGAPLTAVIFGDITNALVDTVRNGFADEEEAKYMPCDCDDDAKNLTERPLFSPSQFESYMTSASLYFILLAILIYISSYIQIFCFQIVSLRLTNKLRIAFFSSVLHQEWTWIEKNHPGELATKYNSDIVTVQGGSGEQLSNLIKQSSLFASGLIVGLSSSWQLSVVILAATPVLAILSAFAGYVMTNMTKREQQSQRKAGEVSEESMSSHITLVSLGGQRSQIRKYEEHLKEGRGLAIDKNAKLAIILGLSMLTLYSTYGLTLYVSTNLILANLLNAGRAMSVIMAVMMSSNALSNVIPSIHSVSAGVSSASSIFEVLDVKPEIDSSKDVGAKLIDVKPDIEFDRVTFSYSNRSSVRILENFSLRIKEGQTVAICGKTGSGKSTIKNLIMRFYDPNEGSVRLNGFDLKDLNVDWLRSLVSSVEQEPNLFDCSVFDNIALGTTREEHKTLKKVVQASKLANAHRFISQLPQGYQTRCGDRGLQMSGGQKQRIAIARALIGDPKILILDEATSALDSSGKAAVRKALKRARRGRTTIVIAHNLSTIKDADLICVIDRGMVVEKGKHEELVAANGEYCHMVSSKISSDSDSNRASTGSGKGTGTLAVIETVIEKTSKTPDQPKASSARDRKPRRSVQKIFIEKKISIITEKISSKMIETTEKEHKISQNYTTTLYESIDQPTEGCLGTKPGKLGKFSDPAELLSMEQVLALFKPEWFPLGMAALASLAFGILCPLFALLYAEILETYTKRDSELSDTGIYWSYLFVVYGLIIGIALAARVYLSSYALETTTARIKLELFINLLRQPSSWHDTSDNSPQRLTARLTSAVPQIKSFMATSASSMIVAASSIITALFFSFFHGWKLAILMAPTLPLLIYIAYLQTKVLKREKNKQNLEAEDSSRYVTESIERLKLIQSMSQERFFKAQLQKKLSKPPGEEEKNVRQAGWIYGLFQSFIYLIYAGAFRFGAYLVAREELSAIGVYRIFFTISLTAINVAQWASGNINSDLNQVTSSIASVRKQLASEPLIDNLANGGAIPDLRGAVSFESISFHYPNRPDVLVLKAFNLEIKQGETVAIVGRSGSGKSTLVALLLRLYDPNSGCIRIDNYDVRCININYLRKNVGTVSQEPTLFKASIKKNILFGLEDLSYSMEDISRAARLANIEDFIMSLPRKYDTILGEYGTQISGGQKQRIAIARTLIRDPKILVLDEVTSALDSKSEALVCEALNNAAQGRTCIKITHRLSSLKKADKIVVMKGGEIVETGKHEDLMSLGQNGYYYRLMQKQTS